jgi:ribosomal protein S18 acetylase RimI-like enzyme
VTISLRPMTDDEFDVWSAHSLESYIGDIVSSGAAVESVARPRAEAQWHELLPEGRATTGTWLLTVIDDGDAVGTLWIGTHPQRSDAGYLYDIAIDEAYQGRGFGRAAMLAAEDLVRGAGLTHLGLNVFGFNERARRLYDSLGYEVVATQMMKRLVPETLPPTI